MLKECKRTGVLSEEVLKKTPGYRIDEIYKERKPLVLIECAEEIPCNPCETSCPNNAITVGDNITNLPIVDTQKCSGCGICVAVCPGHAIFMVNANYKEDSSSVTFAYEYLPVPQKGQIVQAVDRTGNRVCEAVVEKVVSAKNYDMTKVITISIPKEYLGIVRGIELMDRSYKNER